uniref:Jupiter microtubule associated homolog 1b n=1 Tax=Astyanax mexicanus TaxID=7994 RepID=W5LJH7_ASTMX
MTTTTTFQGMEPGAKNSSRVLRPPGGTSNICFGTDEEKPARKNRMASNIFAGPDDPHAHRRNNPPSGEASGVLCGEPSAPLRRCHQPPIYLNNSDPVQHPSNFSEENHEEQNEHSEEVDGKIPLIGGGNCETKSEMMHNPFFRLQDMINHCGVGVTP